MHNKTQNFIIIFTIYLFIIKGKFKLIKTNMNKLIFSLILIRI